MECARCGSPVGSVKLVAGEPPRCEACKWAVMSHQPVDGPNAMPLGQALPAGIPISYQGPRVEVPQVAYARREPGNLAAGAAWGAGVALLGGAGIYGFQVATGQAPWWLFALLGLFVANATYVGNERRVTADTRWIGSLISVVASLVTTYFCARQASIADLGRHGIDSPLPLVVQWDQLTYLLAHAGGPPWWLLAATAGVAGAFPTLQRFRARQGR
jgi:hypothetical protein